MTDSLPLLEQLSAIPNPEGFSPAPVERWNPPFCGDIDMRIAADGTWYYQGTPITRPAMVRLFSRVLWRENDSYFLVTPVEKVGIRVDDAPWVITMVEFGVDTGRPTILFETQVGDRFILSVSHPLRVEFSSAAEPRPYVLVRRNLEALLHRNVYYELINHATEVDLGDETQLVLESAGSAFVIGSFPTSTRDE